MGALERLDMMLNDALYGIIFRDINPLRTLIDQNFSRRINAVAGVVINTGEDNYLTTADAVEQAPAVLASQFINERLAKDAGLEDWQIGLGHAFEIDPELEDGLLYEIAQAEAAREIFPDAPLKYMPPTKHMTGNVFRGYQQNALFVLTSVATGQSIHLLGMLTEALHTPFLHDRWLAIEQAQDDPHATRGTSPRRSPFAPDGRIVRARARGARGTPRRSSRRVAEQGPLRRARRGRLRRHAPAAATAAAGYDGVVRRDPAYANPFLEAWSADAGRSARVSAPQRPVRPYGDKKNDGAVQVSFTLPDRQVRRGDRGGQALRRRRWGSASPTSRSPRRSPRSSPTSSSTAARRTTSTSRRSRPRRRPAAALDREEIDAEIARRFGRRLVVLGCALESDAHTVGLDAIFNMKGFAGDYGLERYHGFDARNLGAQVPGRRGRAAGPRDEGRRRPRLGDGDAERDPHPPPDRPRRHARGRAPARPRRARSRAARAWTTRSPRSSATTPGFGPGTTASRVAAFLLEELSRRHGVAGSGRVSAPSASCCACASAPSRRTTAAASWTAPSS